MCHQKTGRTWIPCPSGWQNIGSVGLGNLIRFRKLDCSPKHPANSWEFQLACAKLGPNTESVKSMCVFADKSDCWEMDVVQQTCLKGSGSGVWESGTRIVRMKSGQRIYTAFNCRSESTLHPQLTEPETRGKVSADIYLYQDWARIGLFWQIVKTCKNHLVVVITTSA